MLKNQIIFLKSKVSDSNPEIQKDTDEFISRMRISSIPFDGKLFFISSGGTEEIFISIYKKYKAPYHIVATNSDNSLPAALEIISFLKQNKLECYLYHGLPEDVAENLRLHHINKIVFNYEFNSEKKILEGERLGVIGKPSDWLIASNVDYNNAKEKLGCELINISYDEFLNNIKKARPLGIGAYKFLVNDKINEDELRSALRINDALTKIIKKYKLDGLTVRCFDLLGTVHTTSCLAFAIINQKRITCTCEGDIPALLSMRILARLFKKSSFQCNPSYVNSEENYVYLAHCTIPFDMCRKYSLDTHFESGIGVGVHGELSRTAVTIFKLNSDLTKFSAFAGKIEENMYKSNLCRTQIKVALKEPVEQLLTSPCGNHLLVAYGDFESSLVKALTK